MTWRVAPSIKALFAEANELWPARSRASDGTIGDQAHAGRKSDHNPGARNLVHAGDLTHDPQHGPDCNVYAELIRERCKAGGERRVSYLIWDRRICSARDGWAWRPYSGVNAHQKHLHVSILSTPEAEIDVSPWFAQWATQPALRRVEQVEVDMVITDYTLTVHTDANGCGWDRVPFAPLRIVGHLAPGLRPEVDGRYLVGQVGFAEDGGNSTVVSVVEWEPNADAVVTLHVAN